MDESKALNKFEDMVGKEVEITLKDGKRYKGKLKAFDAYTNIVLENCKEQEIREIFIAGRNLESAVIIL